MCSQITCLARISQRIDPGSSERTECHSRGEREPQMPRGSVFAWVCVVTAALAGAAFTGWHLVHDHADRTDREARPAPVSPFHECAAEVGLDWRMRYLPTEQGEKFKINLYDHGSGVAIDRKSVV